MALGKVRLQISFAQWIWFTSTSTRSSGFGCDNMEEAIIAEKRREDCVKAHRNFCFKTVLSTERNLNLLKRAAAEGFFIRCYYVLTADPQINVARVATRVSAGGHDVPAEKIIARYDRALDLVKELVPVCDVCHIYDNSLDTPYRIFKKRKSQYWYCTEADLWLKKWRRV